MLNKVFILSILISLIAYISISAQAETTEGYIISLRYDYSEGRLSKVVAHLGDYIGTDTISDSIVISCDKNDCVRHQYLFRHEVIGTGIPFVICIEKIDLSNVSSAKSMIKVLEDSNKNWYKIKGNKLIVFDADESTMPIAASFQEVHDDAFNGGSGVGGPLKMYDDYRVPISCNGSITVITDDD